jgi:hypothetical protein
MATVYIAPTAQGSADGTSAANAYAYSSLSSAESDAGSGGIIYFLDGTYTVGGNSWDNGGHSDMTYKSLNDEGAYLFSSSILSLTIGPSSGTATTKLEGFKAANVYYIAGSGSTAITLNKITHADTVSGSRGSLGIFYFKQGGSSPTSSVTNSSFIIDFSGSDRFTHSVSKTNVSSCTFFIKCSSVGSGGITGFSGTVDATNTIFMSDNSSAIADSVIATSDCTNCCIFQMHSNDSSGGTNNKFADPQFVDSANGDLRLRYYH